MARKSQALILAEAQIAELTTKVGVLMSRLEATAQQSERYEIEGSKAFQLCSDLQNERNELIAENQRLVESCIAAHERCDALELLAAKPASPKKPAPKPLPSPAAVNESPVIQITDADRAVYRKFMALKVSDRKQWDDIIKFARPQFGNVGVDNIQRVRAAWHESKQAS